MRTIVLAGAPGSGKGSVSANLARAENLATFECGPSLQRYADAHDPELKARLASGHMAPTAVLMGLIAEAFAAPQPGKDGWLLDGFPRNPEQADHFIKRVADGSITVDAVIVLDVPLHLAKARCAGRVTCTKCGTIYNTISAPSPAPGICRPDCGGIVTAREMDSDSGIETRMRIFQESTEPAIAMMEESRLQVIHVDAAQSTASVWAQVQAALLTIPRRDRRSTVEAPNTHPHRRASSGDRRSASR